MNAHVTLWRKLPKNVTSDRTLYVPCKFLRDKPPRTPAFQILAKA